MPMRKVLGFFVAISILLAHAPSRSEFSVSALWKARAFDARDELDRLNTKLAQAAPDSQEANFLRCRMMVEFAFANHLAHEELAHKKERDAEAFHIMLNGGKDGLFDLVYVYGYNGSLQAARIDLLPKDWHLTFVPQMPGTAGLRSSTGRCMFGFDLSDPFKAFAIEPDR